MSNFIYIKFYSYIFVVLCVFSCSNKKNDYTTNGRSKCNTDGKTLSINNLNDSIHKLRSMWLEDSNGCLGYRTLEISEIIIKNLLKYDSSKQTFIEVFGNPNEIYTSNNMTNFRYVNETPCLSGNPIEGDNSYIIFLFEDDTFHTRMLITE